MPLTHHAAKEDTAPKPRTFSQNLGFFLKKFAFVLRVKDREITAMEKHTLHLRVSPIPIGGRTHFCPVKSVQQSKESYILALSLQLLRDFVCDSPTQTVASNQIRAGRLYPPDFLDVS